MSKENRQSEEVQLVLGGINDRSSCRCIDRVVVLVLSHLLSLLLLIPLFATSSSRSFHTQVLSQDEMHSHATTIVLALFLSCSSASTITAKAIPSFLRRQNNQACAGFSSLESSCSVKISNFVNLAFTVQASCLCSQSSTYDGFVYDGYYRTCLAYYSTASPSFYSSDLSGDSLPTSPCSLVAAITGGGASVRSDSILTVSAGRVTTAVTTSSSDANAAACTSWNLLQQECSQRITSFSNLPFSSEASCLCYTGSTWAPQKYDGYWASCLSYFKTQNPSLYSTWQSENITNPTPCALVGNIRNGPTLTAGVTATGNSTSASSRVVSTGSASSSSSRLTTTSNTLTVLTTAGTATSTRSSSAANSCRRTSFERMVVLVGCVFWAMVL